MCPVSLQDELATISLGQPVDIPRYFRYWGKAKPESSQFAHYHLLPYHCLDVAAVGWHLLTTTQPLCLRLSAQLQVSPAWLQGFFSYCLILHDLGKFARAFQNLTPSLSSTLVPFAGQCVYNERHDTLGFLLWKKTLVKKLIDIFPTTAKIEPWMEVVCGHHGQPPKRHVVNLSGHFLEEDERAAEAFVRDVSQLWLPDLSPLKHIDKQTFRQVSWQLAGVAVVADWLGSNQATFNYVSEPMTLSDYWQRLALPQGLTAVAEAPLIAPKPNVFKGIQQQFPSIDKPTPLQSYAESVELTDGPQLFLLEDVTGSGKTEAAMLLCQRLICGGMAKGVYVALPTMATANGMYERLAASYRALYDPDSQPSLVLAHGARHLSDGFVDSVALPLQQGDFDYESGEQSASAYCNAWLADSRKKALLADVGVGTIDQVLLAVLPARHQSLRLLGLADKVLLVDEVHAYDPYMRRLLTELLEAHARQGGSVILLSATVPQLLRQELVASFAKGRNGEIPRLTDQNYPLVTHWNSQYVAEVPVETRPSVSRSVSVVRLADESLAMPIIEAAVLAGRCICWIRNTVADAREAFAQVKSQSWMEPSAITLFHSRFAMVDRQAIEKDVLSRFGRESVIAERTGQVLIATQVVEQSLDLDFDDMISDLAPIDLLIQRAGRLQRHNRDASGRVDNRAHDPRAAPSMYIIAPDVDDVVNESWLKQLLPGTQAVYSNVGQLWLTLNVLMRHNRIAMPDDARHLIESVYSDNAQEQIPEALLLATSLALGAAKGEQGMAALNSLRLDKGYTRNSAESSGGWDEEVRIPTRLSAESVCVVLVRPEGDGLKPYAIAEKHSWTLSQISLPEHEWQRVCRKIPSHWEKAIESLKTQMPELKWAEVLPLTDELQNCYSDKGGWTGMQND